MRRSFVRRCGLVLAALTLPILVSSLSIDASALTFTRDPNTNGLVLSGRRGKRFSQSTTTAAGVVKSLTASQVPAASSRLL